VARTIKEIIQEFCYRQNDAAPSSIVGVASATERQYLSLFKYIGDDLRNRPFPWPQLKRPYTFTTVTGKSRYQLPGDFYRLLMNNQWDVTNQWPLLGPVSDSIMTGRQFGVWEAATRRLYRIVGPTNYLFSTAPYAQRSASTFEIDAPGVNDTDELFLGYLSANWLWPRNWVAGQSYVAGDIRSGDGNVYRAATSGTSGNVRPNHTTGTASDGAVDWTVYREPYPCDSSNTNLHDDDFCLFDDDIMIEGLRWAFLKARGLDFQQERVDWDKAVINSSSRFHGTTRVNMTTEAGCYEEWPLTPPGSWPV